MATSLLLEGDDLEALLQRAAAEGGPSARIVRAEKTRQGGVMGFFAKERYEVAVEIPDDDEPPTPGSGTRISRKALRAAGSLTGRPGQDDGPDTFDDLRAPRGRREAGTPTTGSTSPERAASSGYAPVDALLEAFTDRPKPTSGKAATPPEARLAAAQRAWDAAMGPDQGSATATSPETASGTATATAPSGRRSAARPDQPSGQPAYSPASSQAGGDVERLVSGELSPGRLAAEGLLGIVDRVSAAERAAARSIAGQPLSAPQSPAFHVPVQRTPGPDGTSRGLQVPREVEIGQAAQSAAYAAMYAAVYGTEHSDVVDSVTRALVESSDPDGRSSHHGGPGSDGSFGQHGDDGQRGRRSWQAARFPVASSDGAVAAPSRSSRPDVWASVGAGAELAEGRHDVGLWQNVPTHTHTVTEYGGTGTQNGTVPPETPQASARPSTARPEFTALLEQLRSGTRRTSTDTVDGDGFAPIEVRRPALPVPAQSPAAQSPLSAQDLAALERERAAAAAAAEAAAADAARLVSEHLVAERAEAARAQAERVQAEHEAAIRAEAEQLEARRAEAARAEAARIEAERQAAELAVRHAEEQRQLAAQMAAERAQAEAAAQHEAELLAQETARLAALDGEPQAIEAQAAAAIAEQAQRAAAEKAAAERAESERIQAETAARVRAEAERIAGIQIEAHRREAERLAAELAHAERIAAQRAEAERLAAEQAEAERREAQRLAAELAEAERLAAERAEAERVEAERLAAERAESAARRGLTIPRRPLGAAPTSPAAFDLEAMDDDAFDTEPAQALRGSDAQVIADRATLRTLGLPASWTRRLRPGDRFAAVLKVIEPMPDADIDPEVAVVAVIGPAQVVLLEAYRTSLELPIGVKPRPVVVIPATVGAARAAALARAQKHENVVVAIESNGDDDVELVLESLETIQADAVIAVVDAERPLDQTQAWLDALGPVDALCLDGAAVVSAPASVLQLGLPVIRLNGIPIDRVTWTALLCAQLEAARPAELRG